MDNISSAFNDLAIHSSDLWEVFLRYSPRLFGALVVLVAGWFIARLAAYLTRRLLRGLNILLRRRWQLRLGTDIRLPASVIGLSGAIVRWTLFFLVLAVAARILGIAALTTWLVSIVDHMPSILAGGIIVFVGIVVSPFTRDIVTSALYRTAGVRATILGQATQVVVIVTALVMGLGQAGVETTLLVAIVVILLAGLFGGMAIAVGLGARDLVANLIGMHHLQKALPIGQEIRLGESAGQITGVTPKVVVITSPEGRVVIPGGTFQREAVVLVDAKEPEDE